MTQLPRFQQKSLLENLINSEAEAQRNEDRFRRSLSNPFDKPSFDADNLPTFVPQDPTFFSTFIDRFQRDEAALSPLGGRKYALLSLGEMTAGVFKKTELPAPYLEDNTIFMIDGKEHDPADLRLDQVLDNMPDFATALELNGISRDRLKELRVNTGEDFANFYPQMVQYLRTSEALSAYNEQHPFLAGVAGTTQFVTNIATDPLFILGVVFTGGTSTAAREGIKQGAKTALKRTAVKNTVGKVALGPTDAILRRVAAESAERSVMAHALVVGGGATSGGMYSLSADYTAQSHAIGLGLQDPEIHTSPMALGMGVGLGGLLTQAAWNRAVGGSMLSVPKALRRSPESAGSLAAARVNALAVKAAADGKERLGSVRSITHDLNEANASDMVHSIVTALYDANTSRILADSLADGDNLANIDMVKLAEYLSTLPSPEELLAVLTSPSKPLMKADGLSSTVKPPLKDQVNPSRGLPETAYTKLTRDIENYTNQANEFRAVGNVKDANKAQRLADKAKTARDEHIEKNFVLDDTDMGNHILMSTKDIPISSAQSTSERIDLINQGINQIIDRRAFSKLKRSFTSKYHAAMALIGGRLGMPKQHIKADIGSKDNLQALVGYLTGVIDNSGLDGAESLRRADGTILPDAHTRHREMLSNGSFKVKQEMDKLPATANNSQADVFVEVGLSITNGTPIRAELVPLKKAIEDHLKDLGRRGYKEGTIKSLRKNFMPIRLNREIDRIKVEAAWIPAFVNKYFVKFDPSDDKSAVNYRALMKLGFIEQVDGEWKSRTDPLTGEKFFSHDGVEFLPQKVEDLELTPELRTQYEGFLRESLEEDAIESLDKLLGKRGEEIRDVQESGDMSLIRNSSINPGDHRTLLQEIYFDKGVIASGLVDTNLFHTVNGYTKRTGYNIARDETVNELFGQKVGYNNLIKTLEGKVKGNDRATESLARLKKLDQRAGGRFVVDREFAVLGTVLSSLGSTLVSGTLAPTIMMTELGAAIVRSIIRQKDIADHIETFGNALATFRDKERLRNLDIAHESEMTSGRFWFDMNSHLPSDIESKPTVKWSRAVAMGARKVFLERAMTHASKSMIFSDTFAKLHYRRKKIGNLRKAMDVLAEDPENIAGAARAGGISKSDMGLLRDYGILEADMLDAAEDILAVNQRGLFSDKSMTNAIGEIKNPKKAERARELRRRLSKMGLDDAESFVATPGAGELGVTDNALKNLVVSMMSFQATFYSKTLTRVGRAPGWKQAGYMSYLIGAEINNLILRKMMYEKMSVEEIKEEFEDNPAAFIGMAAARLPINGPFSFPSLFGYGIAQGHPEKGFEGLTGGAVPHMATNSVRSIFKVAEAQFKGEELTDSEANNARRYIPGHNAWLLRLIEELPPLRDED